MSTLRCCIVILFGILIFGVAVAENNKFQDEGMNIILSPMK